MSPGTPGTLACDAVDVRTDDDTVMTLKEALLDARRSSLSIGAHIEAVVDELLESPGAVATAVEGDRDATIADQPAHPARNDGRIFVKAALASAVTTKSGSPASSFTQESVVAGIAIRMEVKCAFGRRCLP